FGLRHIEEEAVGKDEPVILAQRPQCREQGGTEGIRLGRSLGGLGRVPRGLGDQGALRQDRPLLGRGPAITRFVSDNAAQPWLERRARAKTAERVVGVHESLLGSVFRVRGVAGDLVGDPKRQLLVVLDKCFICVDIAVFGSFDERYVVQWPALHGSIAIPSYQPAPRPVPAKVALGRMAPPTTRQFLLIDGDDTLWENNVYFEQAIEDFIDFLGHSALSRAQVRATLDEIERLNSRVHGYGSAAFARNLRETYERLAERELHQDDLDHVMHLG